MGNWRQSGRTLWKLALGVLLLSGNGHGQGSEAFRPYGFYLLNPQEAPGQRPSRGPRLTVSDNPPTPFCDQSAFALPGQAWIVDLSAGGVSLQGSRYRSQSVPPLLKVVSPGFPDPPGPANVRLVVIDHFGPIDVTLDEDGPGGDPPQTLPLRHGGLVVAHMRALLESAGYTATPAAPLKYTRGNRTVELLPVDLDVISTEGNTAALVRRLRRLELDAFPGDLVFNMSFAMIPCDLLRNYRVFRDRRLRQTPPQRYTFNAYLEDVARVNGQATRTQRETFIRQLFTRVPPTDPLRPWLLDLQTQRWKAGHHAVAVASSGNYGLPFSTMPGAWDTVLSAGASNAKMGPPGLPGEGNWSDVGDVTAIGEWYTLPQAELLRLCRSSPANSCAAADLLTDPDRYRDFAYRGTSFASPSVAVTLATQLRPGNCFPPGGTGYLPVAGKLGNLPWPGQVCP